MYSLISVVHFGRGNQFLFLVNSSDGISKSASREILGLVPQLGISGTNVTGDSNATTLPVSMASSSKVVSTLTPNFFLAQTNHDISAKIVAKTGDKVAATLP